MQVAAARKNKPLILFDNTDSTVRSFFTRRDHMARFLDQAAGLTAVFELRQPSAETLVVDLAYHVGCQRMCRHTWCGVLRFRLADTIVVLMKQLRHERQIRPGG